jgi:hypothetical protein
MKYSTTINLLPRTSPIITSKVFDTQPHSRIGVLERKNRGLSVAYYFGLAPLPMVFGGRLPAQPAGQPSPFIQPGFSFILLCAFVFDWITTQMQYWITFDLWHPTLARFESTVIPMWMVCESIVICSTLAATIFIVTWFYSYLAGCSDRCLARTHTSHPICLIACCQFPRGQTWGVLVADP